MRYIEIKQELSELYESLDCSSISDLGHTMTHKRIKELEKRLNEIKK